MVPFRLRIRQRMKLLLHLTDDKTETWLFMCVRLGCRKIRSILLRCAAYPQFPPLSGSARNSPRELFMCILMVRRENAHVYFIRTHMLVKYRCAGGRVGGLRSLYRVEIAIRSVHGRERERNVIYFIHHHRRTHKYSNSSGDCISSTVQHMCSGEFYCSLHISIYIYF